MDKLLEALRSKYRSPQAAVEALGLDAALLQPQEKAMPKISPAALVTQAALFTYLQPRLAQDAKIDYNPFVAGITSKNYRSQRPVIANRVKTAAKGKLAQDASLEDLNNLLDALCGNTETADAAAGMPPA